MKQFQDLERCTATFFARHWPIHDNTEEAPTWVQWEPFLFGSVPNHRFAGCYALFAEVNRVYVGLGASRGRGIYEHHGIARRVMAHVVSSDGQRGPNWSRLKENWAQITSLYSIALPHSYAYLSPSLETFLIRELQPPRNSRV